MLYFYEASSLAWAGLLAASLYGDNLDRGLLYLIILLVTQILANQERGK